MTFRLRTIDTTADGRQIVRDRDVDRPELTIGRAAGNDIHLPDLAVDPAHARITRRDGRLAVEALGTLGFGVDGVASRTATIDPAGGAELRFGGYDLTVSQDTDGTPLITIARAASMDAGEATDQKQRFSLAAAMPGKRLLSWVLGAVILAVFLAFPVLSNLRHQADPAAPVHGDKAWSAGPLSLAHHQLEGECVACHVKPFEPVRDAACLSCHKDVHDHAPAARLAMARGGGPLGTRMLWAVAHVFGKEGPGACSECHREHEGESTAAMLSPRQQFCADCHGDLTGRLGDTKLGNAGDFGTLHPQFVVGVVKDPFTRKLTRVSLDASPRENNGLTFPHKLHLDPLGGVARMAATIGRERGYGRAGLQCADCHHPTEDGVRFKPVRMERDCEGCHSLAYDQVDGIVRTLHHGDVDQMMADLSASGYHPPLAPGRRQPGQFSASQFAEGGKYHIDFAPPRYTSTTFRQALSRGGVCGECHTPTMQGGKPGVVPVTQVTRYMVNGWFDHKAHAQEKCTSCHAAETSTSASDVLLPKIAQCRTCHVGENGVSPLLRRTAAQPGHGKDADRLKTPSGCVMCHGYHPSQGAPRNAAHDRFRGDAPRNE
jgi:predicted CXXCH cytochrome family protein